MHCLLSQAQISLIVKKTIVVLKRISQPQNSAARPLQFYGYVKEWKGRHSQVIALLLFVLLFLF
jgi:hypothetical protein